MGSGSEEVPSEATAEASVSVVPIARRAKVPYLQQIGGQGAPKKFLLTKPEMVIGRDQKADISVRSGNVSRHHALIKCRQQEVSIVDFESRNGVLLNGVKIHSAVLRDGDVIQMADILLEYCED